MSMTSPITGDRRSPGAVTKRKGEETSTTATLEPSRKPQRRHARLSQQELTKLVRSSAAGDQCAWNALVHEFGSMILAIARAHGLHDAGAADVAQITWLRLFEHSGRLNDPARVGAWLATTARHEALRLLRDNDRHVLYGDDIPGHQAYDSPPVDALLIEERDDALWRVVSRLRASDQALLRVLVADPQPSYEEISAALHIPIGSIGPTRQRALERLRGELAKQGTLTLLTT